MTIKTFIEKAIKGGWKKELSGHKIRFERDYAYFQGNPDELDYMCYHEKILLDPLAWQAVGRVSGWGDKRLRTAENGFVPSMKYYDHRVHMHRFIDALCDGKDLETALDLATKNNEGV